MTNVVDKKDMTDSSKQTSRHRLNKKRTVRKLDADNPHHGRRKIIASAKSGSNYRYKDKGSGSDRRIEGQAIQSSYPLPAGPVVQVIYPEHRLLTDRFLMNTTRVLTSFRAILQGPDGGHHGSLEASIFAWIKDDSCLAALAVKPDNTWLIHAIDHSACRELVTCVAKLIFPGRIEGEPYIVKEVLDNPVFDKSINPSIHQYLHLELEYPQRLKEPSGQMRFAVVKDINRLEQYCEEYKRETGENPPCDWRRLIAEKRILIVITEGTQASIIQRGATTIDRLQIEGLFTYKPFRRRGYASNLVSTLVQQARGRGCIVSAIVKTNNTPALSLLKKLGFAITSEYSVAILNLQ